MTNGTARTNVLLAIDDTRCRVCEICLARQACRGKAIRVIDRDDPPFLDMSRCWGCRVCVTACPHGAVVRHEIEP
ncbi:MAG: 4Fe-4S binding protein [Anaerolineae bacterium]|nr:4Fe-4S binding protein [Anaerolineae bacterium]